MNQNILFSLCEHFGLKNLPFLNRPRVPFEYEEYLKNTILISSVFYSRQLAVVTGSPGAGKSSLLTYAMNTLDPASFRLCHVELSEPKKKAMYKAIASKMGLHPAFGADDIKLQIINFFAEENEQGKFNCIMIDEAHTLSIAMLDELRSFYDEGGNFSLILAGLPQLVTKTLNLSVNTPLKQRVNIFIDVAPLTLAQTREYIQTLLKQAHASSDIFDEKCFSFLHSATSGLPRRINQICYQTLLQGYFDKKNIVTLEDLQLLSKKMPHIFPSGGDNPTGNHSFRN